MVSFNEMKNIQSYSNSSKKMEEEALLQRLIDKKAAQKSQDKNLQEAMQTQKAADAQKFEGIKSKYETQFKALEQIAKQLNVKVQDLNSNLIKQAVTSLDKTQQEVVQSILKNEQLSQLKQEHQNYQLKNKGVEQQFSKEMQLMESIAKALRVPVDQLSAGDVQKFLQIIKKSSSENVTAQEQVDQLAKELGVPKEQLSTKDIQKLLDLFGKQKLGARQQSGDVQSKQTEVKADSKFDKLEARQEEIQKILDKLKGKQEEALNRLNSKDQESQKVLEKQIGTLQGKLGQLEQSLQQLSSQINKTVDKGKKEELEARKSELEGQIKDLKGSMKDLQSQRTSRQEESSQLKGKYEKATKGQDEAGQIESRLKELSKLEHQLLSKSDKTTEESKNTQIKEKLEAVRHEKEALTKTLEASGIKTGTNKMDAHGLSKKETNNDVQTGDSETGENIAKPEKKELEKKDLSAVERKVVKEEVPIKQSLIKDIFLKLDKAEADLRFREVFEKEINQQSSKEVNNKLIEVKSTLKDVQFLKDNLGQINKLPNADKAAALKQILGEIKSDQLKSKIEATIRQSNVANEIVDSIVTGNKSEISDAEAVLVSACDLDDLSEEQLAKLFDVMGDKVGQLKVSVNSISALKQAMKAEAVEIKEQRENLVSTLKTIVETKSSGNLGANEILALFNTGSLGRESIEQLMKQFENLQTMESQVQFVLLLRDLFGKDVNALRLLASMLVADGKVDESFIEEELGVLFTKDGAVEGAPVSREALAVLSKFAKISPEQLANNEGLQQMVQKGRIDREIFEKLVKKQVSEDAWDYGVMSFNKNNVGLLKERAEINSLEDFWKLMERFSSGGESDVLETAELFLSTIKFTVYQRELISFFVTQYQEYFIDPDFHLFDLYSKYMDGNTFSQLSEASREELCLAVLVRMVKSFEGPNKHQQFEKLIEMTKQKEDTLDFIRSVEVFEFYFSHGGMINREYLDANKELRLFDNVTQWNDELKSELDENTISKMIVGFTKPTKKLDSVNLGKLSDRFKKKTS